MELPTTKRRIPKTNTTTMSHLFAYSWTPKLRDFLKQNKIPFHSDNILIFVAIKPYKNPTNKTLELAHHLIFNTTQQTPTTLKGTIYSSIEKARENPWIIDKKEKRKIIRIMEVNKTKNG
jgi:hypothetical protein